MARILIPSPIMKIPAPSRSTVVLSTFLATTFLQGCLSDGAGPPTASPAATGSATVRISPILAPSAARTLAAEPGGWLVAKIRRPGRTEAWTDSVQWLGSSPTSMTFLGLPEATNYLVSAFYRDAGGRVTHSDSVSPVAILPGISTPVPLALRVLLGRIVISMPTVPATVDSLGISWIGLSGTRRAVVARGTSGKTVLRLDSLPVGSTGATRLRAWNSAGDTLYRCDTVLSIASQADQSLSLRWMEASGSIALAAAILPGGETDATALFPGDEIPNGSLRLLGLSDSSGSDWALIDNPGTGSVTGQITLVHGTESVMATISLAPGATATLSRVSCADATRIDHPLHGAPGLVCGLSLSVAWSSTGTLWELRGPGGTLAERTVVWDGKNGWPDLNSSTARTLRRRRTADGADPMNGRSWCTDGLDDPARPCS